MKIPNATSLYLEWNDPDVDDSDVDNPELNIDYVQARHGQSFHDYINEIIPKTNYIDYQIHKDQEMSDRFGVEVSKVTCREEEVEEEGALETHVEGYFFVYEGNYGGILFRSKGTEFDEAKRVIISDMKLVIKTEAEMDKDREEYRRKLAEEKIKEEERSF